MQTAKIDKMNNTRPLSKIVRTSFGNSCTTEKAKNRRKQITRLLGIGSASKYIGSMIKWSKVVIDKMNEQGETEIASNMSLLTFSIFADILFGKDVQILIDETRPYINQDGSVDQLTLRDFFFRVSKDYIEEQVNPITYIFPIMSHYNLINPYRTNIKNLNVMHEAFRGLMKRSNDTESV